MLYSQFLILTVEPLRINTIYIDLDWLSLVQYLLYFIVHVFLPYSCNTNVSMNAKLTKYETRLVNCSQSS